MSCTRAPVIRALSLLPSPGPPYAEPCSANTPKLQTWSVIVVVLATGPGLDSVHQRWRIQALPGQQVPILRTYLQLHSLHWPQQPYLRSLKDFGDTRLGWDLGPLLWYLRDDSRGPGPPSGPGHQARGSHQDPGLSRHLPS